MRFPFCNRFAQVEMHSTRRVQHKVSKPCELAVRRRRMDIEADKKETGFQDISFDEKSFLRQLFDNSTEVDLFAPGNYEQQIAHGLSLQ